MFTDRIKLTFKGGKGGSGIIAWRRETYVPKGGPSGGNGGPGGSIFLEVDPAHYSLDHLRKQKHLIAQDGMSGGSSHKSGKRGRDLTVKVPPGTLVKDPLTGQVLWDLSHPGESILLCRGGKGGLGNAFFRNPTRQAPYIATPGKAGEEKELELELKMIADIGLVGYPNAGKTTLFNALSSQSAKVGAYPFTTLAPNLATLTRADFSRYILADIPGIIDGAHQGKGLGLEFIKHIERCHLLVFVLDATEDPASQLDRLRCELNNYSPALLEKPSLIVLTKWDLASGHEAFLQEHPTTVCVSAPTGLHIAELRTTLEKAHT